MLDFVVAMELGHPSKVVQPVATSEVLEETLSLLARHSSLRVNMLHVVVKLGSTVELAMMSTMLEKRRLRPRRRLRTRSESWTG